MPRTRFRLPAAVYGVLRVDDWILMLRRAGTEFRPGQLSLPAGHLEGGEDAVGGLLRELREQVGVEAVPADCRLAMLVHSSPEHEDDSEYLHLFFIIERWSGGPLIGEPNKCSELVWVTPAALPADVVDYVADALGAIERGEPLLLWGWDRSDLTALRDDSVNGTCGRRRRPRSRADRAIVICSASRIRTRREAFEVLSARRPPGALLGLGVPAQKEDVREQG